MGKFKANSYFFYMQEQKRKIPAWKDKSNQELMVLCDQGWQALSPVEKRRFEDMKEEFKKKDPEATEKDRRKGEVRIEGGYDSLGNSLVGIKKRDLERIKEEKDKIDAVKNVVERAALAGTLESAQFNIIETNVFVKIPEDKIYVPAEISIAKFSLQEGLIKVYQAFPEAGKIPLGYKRECLENSNKGHKIPLEKEAMEPMNCQVEDNVEFNQTLDRKILQDISNHLSGADIVFCMPEMMAQCEGILRTIANRCSSFIMSSIMFVPLPELLYMLANKSQEGIMIPTPGVAERELESERFLYKSGLSCPWHESMTETNTCSSATVCRLSFTVLDLCCQHYKIPLVSGKHIPKTMETEPLGKEWLVGKTTANVRIRNSTVRKPGGFASEDVRLREEAIEDKKDVAGGGSIVGEKVNPIEAIQKYSEKVKQEMNKDMMQAGTISDYMGAVTESVGNLSVSDCSSDSEFVTLDSISQVSAAPPMARMHPSVVVKKGVGRGSVLPGRRPSRLAATFPGMGKDQGK